MRVEIVTLFLRPRPDHYMMPLNRQGFNVIEVVLIPGVYEDWRFMKPIADALYHEGYKIHVLEGLGYNRGTVEAMAALATDYARTHIVGDYVLVAHSKGGLIGKYMLIDPKRSPHLKGLIALNSPFSGSKYAYLLPPLPSLSIFRPNSKIISALAMHTKQNQDIISIYGTFDPHIPGGSRLDGATNIQLPTKGHFKVVADKRVLRTIVRCVRDFS